MPLPISRPMWKGGELVMPMTPHDSLVEGTINLGDFGLAIKSSTSVECKVQSPAIYYAPERIHDMDPSFASDMWSFMCIFAELYLGFPLFMAQRTLQRLTSWLELWGPFLYPGKALIKVMGNTTSRGTIRPEGRNPD
ncbi:hypothetical protein GGI43DRAFT_167756 [Trichoderma evansii]